MSIGETAGTALSGTGNAIGVRTTESIVAGRQQPGVITDGIKAAQARSAICSTANSSALP